MPLFETSRGRSSSFPFTDFRLTPHYPAKSALDDVLLKVVPGADEYLTEKYAFEIMALLKQWSVDLRTAPPGLASLTNFLDASIATSALLPTREVARRSDHGIEILQRRFARDVIPGRERFLREMENYLAPMSRVETAEFEIVGTTVSETRVGPALVEFAAAGAALGVVAGVITLPFLVWWHRYRRVGN